jgi:drug/metabolite transporter (DMT)-like permease
MAAVLLRGRIFSRWAAWAGILGGILLLLFTISATFMPSTFNVVMFLAMLGGLLSMAYNVMVARRLFQLAAEMQSR